MGEQKEAMEVFISVFNSHVNDAAAFAKRYMKTYYPQMAAEVRFVETQGGGGMAIFDQAPSLATSFYAGMVCALVNQGRDIPPPSPDTVRKMEEVG